MEDLIAILPTPTDASKPFWHACNSGVLQLPHCQAVRPRLLLSAPELPALRQHRHLMRDKSAGNGRVFSFTHVHVSFYGDSGNPSFPIRRCWSILTKACGCSAGWSDRTGTRSRSAIELSSSSWKSRDRSFRFSNARREQDSRGTCGTNVARTKLLGRRKCRSHDATPSPGPLARRLRLTARANEWPDKPVFWICPFAPGGGADTISRLVGARARQPLRPARHRRQQVRRIEPDRHAADRIGRAGRLYGRPFDRRPLRQPRAGTGLGYDADKDFTYISQLIRVPMGMFTSGKNQNCERCPA